MNALEFKGVSKIYRLYRRPADRLIELVTRTRRCELFSAVTDVSFSVPAGQTFGLVGENGAGKSTILKIAAGTIQPSTGSTTLEGPVSALLELGAGFHPEESGFENIRFMAALYGVPSDQLVAFTRSVVAFSELDESALNRPVKTYSSGMFMRLAFSAATAVNPRVLIVDEALSVGDLHFQKKSLNRIMKMRDQGVTILFCSHNLYQIRSLCQSAAWIRNGRIEKIGVTEPVVTAYENYERKKHLQTSEEAPQPEIAVTAEMAAGTGEAQRASEPLPERYAGEVPLGKIEAITAFDRDGQRLTTLATQSDVRLTVKIRSFTNEPFNVVFAIVRADKDNIFGSGTHLDGKGVVLKGKGIHRISVLFDQLNLLSGEYFWSIYLLDDTGLQVIDMAEIVEPFTVLSEPRHGFGITALNYGWDVRYESVGV